MVTLWILVKLSGSQKQTNKKRYRCLNRNCTEENNCRNRRVLQSVWGYSNQNAFYTCVKFLQINTIIKTWVTLLVFCLKETTNRIAFLFCFILIFIASSKEVLASYWHDSQHRYIRMNWIPMRKRNYKNISILLRSVHNTVMLVYTLTTEKSPRHV